MDLPIPEAVIVVIKDGAHYAAMKSVKRNGLISFIGGKVEPGESLEAAAIREAYEECGVRIKGVEIVAARNDGKRMCTLVVATKWYMPLGNLLRFSEEGESFWATREELTGEESAYPEWNKWAFEQLDAHQAVHPPAYGQIRARRLPSGLHTFAVVGPYGSDIEGHKLYSITGTPLTLEQGSSVKTEYPLIIGQISEMDIWMKSLTFTE